VSLPSDLATNGNDLRLRIEETVCIASSDFQRFGRYLPLEVDVTKKSTMSGRGNGGKGLGKGGAKRHRKVLRDQIHGITKVCYL